MRGAPATLAGDDLEAVAVGHGAAHQDRLQDTVGADRLGETLQLRLVEAAAWLRRVRADSHDRDFPGRAQSVDGRVVVRIVVQQGREAPPQAAPFAFAGHAAFAAESRRSISLANRI